MSKKKTDDATDPLIETMLSLLKERSHNARRIGISHPDVRSRLLRVLLKKGLNQALGAAGVDNQFLV